jgi:host factor-I protein
MPTASDVQADFLSALMRERKLVWVFLVNGIKLTGQSTGFDKYVLTLQSPTGIQAVFKSAISTVCESHFVENRGMKGRLASPRERQPAKGPPR